MRDSLSRIRDLFHMDVSQLYQSLVDYEEDYRGVLFSPSEKTRIGQRIFGRIRPALYEKVCVEWGYCAKRQQPDLQDQLVLAATVADLVTSACGGIPPFNVAVLLVRLGLSNLCNCDGDRGKKN